MSSKKIYPKNFQIISGGIFRETISRNECTGFDRLYAEAQYFGQGNRKVQGICTFDNECLTISIPSSINMRLGDYDYKVLGYLGTDLVVIKYGRIRVIG